MSLSQRVLAGNTFTAEYLVTWKYPMRTHAVEEKIVMQNYIKMYGIRHRCNVPAL